MTKAERVYFDTFVFMDLLSGNKDMADRAESHMRKYSGVVSAILLTELAYHIAKRKRRLAGEVLFCVRSLPGLDIIPLDQETAGLAGAIRARYRGKIQKRLTYFDCIHIATAIRAGCKKFITGDRGFREISDIEMEIY